MTHPAPSAAFIELEAENARLKATISDAVQGMNDMAGKIATCGVYLGFRADQSKEEIGEICRKQNAELFFLRKQLNPPAPVPA